MRLPKFRTTLGNTNPNLNTLGYAIYVPHGSSGVATLIQPTVAVKNHTGDCFPITTYDKDCFSVSSSESDCFYIKNEYEKKLPLPETIDLEPFGIMNIYAIHAQGLSDLFVACSYQPENGDDPYLALVKLLYIKSVDGGIGTVSSITGITNIEHDGIVDGGQIKGITGYDNKGLSDFFISYGSSDCTADVYIYDSVLMTNSNILEPQTGLLGFAASGWLTKDLLFAYTSGQCNGLAQVPKIEIGTPCPSACGAGDGLGTQKLIGVNSFNGNFETSDIIMKNGKLAPANGSCAGGNTILYYSQTAMVREDLILGDYASMSASEATCFYNQDGVGLSAQVSDGTFYYINNHDDYNNPTGSYRACWDGRFLLTWDVTYGVKVTDLTDGWSNTYGAFKDHSLSYGVLLTVGGGATISQEVMGDA